MALSSTDFVGDYDQYYQDDIERACQRIYDMHEIIKQHAAKDNLSHVMRKPVYAICEQQRRRSACASAHSDQRVCYSLPPLVSISEMSSLWLATEAEQTSLSLTWSETPMISFLVKWLI